MIGLCLLLTVACLITALAPGSSLGKALHHALVAEPARLLNLSPLKTLVVAVVFVCVVALAMAAPELAAALGVTDLWACLDLVVVSTMLAAASVARAAGRALVHAARRLPRRLAVARARQRARARRIARPRRPAPSDDGWPAGAWAMA